MTQRDQFSEFDFDAGPTGPSEPREPGPEEMVPISRLNEVIAQRDKSEGQRDQVIQSMLNGQQAPSAEADLEEPIVDPLKFELPEGTDPEVAKLSRVSQAALMVSTMCVRTLCVCSKG
jgi:hypothetical protein